MSEPPSERNSTPARHRAPVSNLITSAAWTSSTLIALFALAWILFPLPEDILHPGPGGGIVLDDRGSIIISVVAGDDQRRIPIDLDRAGSLISEAVVAVEDHAFHGHIGIDPAAVLGAIRDNLLAGRVVRGASTITMQVAGLKLGHPRTIPGKVVEAFRSLQMEADHDKDEILESWLNLAPFGGNLVGVEAASQGWFGKPARECTLAEAALLVGLPNSPERFRPDIHPEAAMRRRAVVLDRMVTAGLIDDDRRRRAALAPTGSMWVFGSLRSFMAIADRFTDAGLRLAQEIVWEKQNGTSFHADRFKRVHELAVQFYPTGTPWRDIYNDPQTTPDATARLVELPDGRVASSAGGAFVARSGSGTSGHCHCPTATDLGICS